MHLPKIGFSLLLLLFFPGLIRVARASSDYPVISPEEWPVPSPEIFIAENTASTSFTRRNFFATYQDEILQTLPGNAYFRLPVNLYLLSLPNQGQEWADLQPCGVKD
jgi:hypothetical protein